MIKVSSEQVSAVAARGAVTIRSLIEKTAALQSENATLREKIAEFERNQEIQTIAADMEEKGLNVELSMEEKIAHIRQYTDLDKVREAVKMAGAGSVRLAEVSDQPGRGALDAFTAFCVGAD